MPNKHTPAGLLPHTHAHHTTEGKETNAIALTRAPRCTGARNKSRGPNPVAPTNHLCIHTQQWASIPTLHSVVPSTTRSAYRAFNWSPRIHTTDTRSLTARRCDVLRRLPRSHTRRRWSELPHSQTPPTPVYVCIHGKVRGAAKLNSKSCPSKAELGVLQV